MRSEFFFVIALVLQLASHVDQISAYIEDFLASSALVYCLLLLSTNWSIQYTYDNVYKVKVHPSFTPSLRLQSSPPSPFMKSSTTCSPTTPNSPAYTDQPNQLSRNIHQEEYSSNGVAVADEQYKR